MLTTRPPEPASTSIPTLRSIEDVHGRVDLDKVVDLGKLYELAIDTSNAEHAERMGVWHPSSCGYCRRAEVLQFLRTPPTDEQSKKLKEIFAMGHLVHELVQSKFEQLAPHLKRRGFQYTFQREVPFDPETDRLYLELGIGGTCDGIVRIWNAVFEQRILLEAKSQSHDRHEKLKVMATAWPTHLLQSHIYSWRFDIPVITVFYFNKNNSKRETRTQLFSHEIFDTAIMYFSECNDYVARGELPPREESYLECVDCRYRSMCKPEVLRRKKALNTVPVTALRRR